MPHRPGVASVPSLFSESASNIILISLFERRSFSIFLIFQCDNDVSKAGEQGSTPHRPGDRGRLSTFSVIRVSNKILSRLFENKRRILKSFSRFPLFRGMFLNIGQNYVNSPPPSLSKIGGNSESGHGSIKFFAAKELNNFFQ